MSLGEIKEVLGDDKVNETITDIGDIFRSAKTILDTIFGKENVQPVYSNSKEESWETQTSNPYTEQPSLNNVPSWALAGGAVILLILLIKVV